MAPFIPQGLINPELNLFYALILGIAFGYVLEQAGFSSSRKLAGVFYGYDFVVLRVFFTAGITAMTGLVILSYAGWIDMSLVYINPTFLWSAILGGAIMGFGFIMGGFCPGTSVVAAVIGRIDAIVFVGGMMIGIFIFGHFYDAWLPLYNGSFLGNITIYETLGMSRSLFAFILVFVALLAFAITQFIEDKVNNIPPDVALNRPSYRLPAMLILLMVFINLWLPEQRSSYLRETAAKKLLEQSLGNDKFIPAQEVTYHLMQGTRNMVLIDTRPEDDFLRFSLPGAINIPAADILERHWRDFFRNDPRRKVFFSAGESDAARAWISCTRAGYTNVFIMQAGLNGLFSQVFTPLPHEKETKNGRQEFQVRFVENARKFFRDGPGTSTPAPSQIPVRINRELPVAAAGGC